MLADDRSALPDGARRVRDEDAAGLIRIVGEAFEEHPGCVLDLPGLDDDLPAPATTAGRRGSPWWVVERGGRVVASIGAGTVQDDGTVELKRLYVDRTQRGRGLATQLVGVVERQAAGLGASTVELWSDTRFTAAHHRYEQLGYRRTGQERELHDPSETTEYRLVKAITPAMPAATAAWHGPSGREDAAVTSLPDGWNLTTAVPTLPLVASVEVDASWVTRRASLTLGGVTRSLTSDGRGRWWWDGVERPDLAGALDVDIEASPLTNTLPIRRLLARGLDEAEVTAAWIRVAAGTVEPLHQRYRRIGPSTWRYRSSTGFEATLTVDGDGLVHDYGDVWSRV